MHPACNPPHGHWNATIGACDCDAMWYGESCQNMHCADYDPEQDNPDCSAHGMCVQGTCFCAAGWGIKPGDAGANICKDAVCPVDCGEHGMCEGNMCTCQEGWQGPACREPKCVDDCSGHGTCTFTLANSPAECVCEYGWNPPACNKLALYQKLQSCPNDCSGNGLCMDGHCVCQSGSTGLDCSMVVCPPGKTGPACEYKGCLRDCSGYGVCFNGECACDNDHTGDDCSIPMKCYEPCHEVCLADLLSSRCEFCKGQCLTLHVNPVIGDHNPMLARLYSFPQLSAGGNAAHTKVRAASSLPKSNRSLPGRRLRKRHHDEVSAVQTGHHPLKTLKRQHHHEVSSVKVGHYSQPSADDLRV